jgi:hypothetical protein
MRALALHVSLFICVHSSPARFQKNSVFAMTRAGPLAFMELRLLLSKCLLLSFHFYFGLLNKTEKGVRFLFFSVFSPYRFPVRRKNGRDLHHSLATIPLAGNWREHERSDLFLDAFPAPTHGVPQIDSKAIPINNQEMTRWRFKIRSRH